MSKTTPIAIFVIGLLVFSSSTFAAPGQQDRSDAPLTNQTILKMTAGKLSPVVIAMVIQGSESNDFDTSPDTLITLTGQGVDPLVQAAMLEAVKRQKDALAASEDAKKRERQAATTRQLIKELESQLAEQQAKKNSATTDSQSFQNMANSFRAGCDRSNSATVGSCIGADTAASVATIREAATRQLDARIQELNAKLAALRLASANGEGLSILSEAGVDVPIRPTPPQAPSSVSAIRPDGWCEVKYGEWLRVNVHIFSKGRLYFGGDCVQFIGDKGKWFSCPASQLTLYNPKMKSGIEFVCPNQKGRPLIRGDEEAIFATFDKLKSGLPNDRQSGDTRGHVTDHIFPPPASSPTAATETRVVKAP